MSHQLDFIQLQLLRALATAWYRKRSPFRGLVGADVLTFNHEGFDDPLVIPDFEIEALEQAGAVQIRSRSSSKFEFVVTPRGLELAANGGQPAPSIADRRRKLSIQSLTLLEELVAAAEAGGRGHAFLFPTRPGNALTTVRHPGLSGGERVLSNQALMPLVAAEYLSFEIEMHKAWTGSVGRVSITLEGLELVERRCAARENRMPVPQAITNTFNNYGNAINNLGEVHGSQKVANSVSGLDLGELFQALREFGVTDGRISELEAAIDADRDDSGEAKFSSSLRRWVTETANETIPNALGPGLAAGAVIVASHLENILRGFLRF